MSRDLVSIEADAAVEIAERLLAVPGITTLAVVDRGAECIGLIDRADVRHGPHRGRRVTSRAGRVRDLMRPPSPSVSPNALATDAVAQLINDAQERAIVVDALDRPLGILWSTALTCRSSSAVCDEDSDSVTEWDPRLS